MTNGLRRSLGWLTIAATFFAAAVAIAAKQPAATPQAGQAGQPPAGRGAGAPEGAARGAQAGRRGGTPPPIPWPAPELPDGPISIQSAEPAHRNLRLVVTKGLSHPWAMAFLPDGGILITERSGRLRIVRGGVLDPT